MEQATREASVESAGQVESAREPSVGETPTGPRVAISARFLLAIYAIVPLCLLAMAVDHLFFTESFFRAMPTSPENNFYFQLAFGTPHIIASSIILAANTEYLRCYWLRLVVFTAVVIAFFGIGSLYIPYAGFFAIVGAATVLHVIKQQVGIGKGLCRISSWTYDAWGWTLVVFGSILYYTLYMGDGFAPNTKAWVHGLLAALAGLVLVLTVICHWQIPSGMGRLYLWANAAMVLQSSLFYAADYPFLAILGPRLVHDITAFTFYVTHDMNKHGDEAQSALYWLPDKLGLGVFWVCPLLAVALTYFFTRHFDDLAGLATPMLGFELPYGASFLVVGYLGLLHYYTEAFTWRQGSPYRPHYGFTS
ncbi:MAG: hypothetical protein HYR84_06740 [Planctomycetes bacterium]|nr:hypothetical protein [Planctomycetota bacterium]